ncbi:MAG: MBL fold metallo-hydrolase [Anaerolineae bacterium]|nr:MBL fold metallo-hydrolase [Anaerolineae bacterium]
MAHLTIIDVGHGNSAVLEDSNGVVIIDAGPRNGLLEFLVQENIVKIGVVLLSHADQDHIGGLINLLASENFEIGIVRINTDASKSSEIWDDLAYELALQQETHQIDFEPSLTTADSGKFNQGDVYIQILGPSTYLAAKGPGSNDRIGRPITANSVSAVIRLLDNERPVALFPGDIDEIGLDDLLERVQDVKSPVLVFPHHGGLAGTAEATSLFTKRLTENVAPESIIFSIGRNQKTPRSEVIMAIREIHPHVRISCTQLSEKCANILPAELPSYTKYKFAKGAESRKCCAGTIVIDIQTGQIHPPYEQHQLFITSHAPTTAICRQKDF